MRYYNQKRKNLDRRNAAGGIGQGERTIRKGGWVVLLEDIFYSPRLQPFAGQRVFINNLSDAFSPEYATAQLTWNDEIIDIRNIYHLACKGQLPAHLEHLRARLGKLSTI
jgi:hypothetical protein